MRNFLVKILFVMAIILPAFGNAFAETPEFTITTTNMAAGTTFSFKMSAAGEFTVDWGDGNTQTITRTNATETTYSHTYTTAGTYTIGMSGQATGYWMNAAVSFANNLNIAGIRGSLGAIFGTTDPTKLYNSPKFKHTFEGCTNLKGSIPENLFAEINEAPVSEMFVGTFKGCSGLSGSIPENLFAGISGVPASSMFRDTFSGCSGLTGSIPENLFAGISGAPAGSMFRDTFSGCSGLTGSIPENLFARISGAPAASMFGGTFANCSGLTGSIPENLFAGISGAPAQEMFTSTFANCSGLSGSIPENLFAGISGAPAKYMFLRTFNYDKGLSGYIPAGLFGGVSGARADGDFSQTFYTTGLGTTCPSGIPNATINTDPSITSLDGRAICGCVAGTYIDNGTCTACPTNLKSRAGATSVNDCGRFLHIGDETLLLHTSKVTTPSLNVQLGDDVFYGNMAPGDITIRPGSQRKLKTIWNNTVYSIYEK